MIDLKLSVIRKEGELVKMTREMEEKYKEIKEKEEEAVLLKDEADYLQKEIKSSQDSVNTHKQLSITKTMELEDIKKQIKELCDVKHLIQDF